MKTGLTTKMLPADPAGVNEAARRLAEGGLVAHVRLRRVEAT